MGEGGLGSPGLCHYLAVFPQAGHLTSVSLGFITSIINETDGSWSNLPD